MTVSLRTIILACIWLRPIKQCRHEQKQPNQTTEEQEVTPRTTICLSPTLGLEVVLGLWSGRPQVLSCLRRHRLF